MANADKTLLNKDNLEIYPITRERNVYDENNVNLKEKFKTVVFKDNEVHKFSKELYDESVNIIDTEDSFGIFEGVEYKTIKNKTILNGTATYSGNIWIKIKKPIKAGTIFSFNQFTNDENLKKGVIWLGKAINDWDNRIQVQDGRANISVNYDINYISIYVTKGTNYSLSHITPMAVLGKVKPTTYFEYNPNRHITNSEAEFLQEECEKNLNKFDEIVTRGNADNNTGTFTYTSTGNNLLSVNYMPMKPNTIYSYKTSKSGLWIYEYDSNRKFLGIVDIVSGSSFTSKPNTAYFRVAFWGGYGTTYLNDAIVKEGINPIYHPYNSASHITNPQAEFLREEHNKTINEFDKNNLNLIGYGYIGPSSKMIIYTADVPAYYVECKPNVTYTISKKAGKYFRVATFDKIPEIDKTVGLQAIRDDEGTSITITTDSNAKYLVFNIYSSTNDTITLQEMLDTVQIEKGSVATSWNEWNGSIIHEKDIEPILLWKNGNPNIAFDYQENSIPSMKDYEEFDLYYASSSSNIAGRQKFSFKNSGNNQQYLFISTDNVTDAGVVETRSRMIVYKNFNSILFREGYKNNVQNNEMIIPLELYGRKRSV